MRIKYKICFEIPTTLGDIKPLLNCLGDKKYNPGFNYDGNCISGTLTIDKTLKSNDIKKLEKIVGKFSLEILK